MYVIKDGKLRPAEERTVWILVVKDPEEDVDDIVDEIPLYYSYYDQLINFINSNSGKQDIKKWEEKGMIWYYRPINVCVDVNDKF